MGTARRIRQRAREFRRAPAALRYLAPMKPELILVHHPEVEPRWQGVCYGHMDARLSPAGEGKIPRLADELAAFGPGAIFSSPASRAATLAKALSERTGIPVRLEPRLAERNYGSWEGQTWAQIQATDRDAMRQLLDDPEHFAPPGGETLFGVRDRMHAWLQSLPNAEMIIAITHGGPIGALLGSLQGRPPADWPSLVPPMGERVRLTLD